MNASAYLERRARILGIPVTNAAGRRIANSTLMQRVQAAEEGTGTLLKPTAPRGRRASLSKKAMLVAGAGLMLAGAASRGIPLARPSKYLTNNRYVTPETWPIVRNAYVQPMRTNLLKNNYLRSVYTQSSAAANAVNPTHVKRYTNLIGTKVRNAFFSKPHNAPANESSRTNVAIVPSRRTGTRSGNTIMSGVPVAPTKNRQGGKGNSIQFLMTHVLPLANMRTEMAKIGALGALEALGVNNMSVGGMARRAGGVDVRFKKMGLTVHLDKMPALNALPLKTFREWTAMQTYMSKANVPLTTQDEHQKLMVIDVVSKVLDTNPLCQAELDSEGIAPGTHLATPYENSYPLIGKGVSAFSTRLARTKIKLHWSGWGDASGFDGLSAVFHHGIYLGNGWVVHVGGGGYARVANGNHTNRVGIDTLMMMSFFGRGLYVVEHPTQRPPQQILFDAINAVGQWKYDKITNNCEHFATEMSTGTPISAQIENGMWAMALIGITALVSGAVPAARCFIKAARLARNLIDAVKYVRQNKIAESSKITVALARQINEPPGPIVAQVRAAAKSVSRRPRAALRKLRLMKLIKMKLHSDAVRRSLKRLRKGLGAAPWRSRMTRRVGSK